MTSSPLDRVLVRKAHGRFGSALRCLQRVDPAARTGRRGAYLTASAELLHLTGDGEAAEMAARRGLRSSTATSDCRARCYAVLGSTAAERGDAARSLGRFRRAVEAARDAGEAALGGWIRLDLLAHLAERLGSPARARLLEESSRAATVAGCPLLHARLHLTLAEIDARQGRTAPALAHLGAAETLLGVRRNAWLAGLLALARADLCLLNGDHSEAGDHGRSALAQAARSGHLATRVGATARLARAELAVGNLRESEALCGEVLAAAGTATRVRIAVLDTLARIGLHRGRPDECRRRLAEVDDAVREQGGFPPSCEELTAYPTRVRLAMAGGAWHDALAIADNGIAKADESEDLPRGLSLRCLKADACRQLGRADLAARALAEAREMADGAPLPLRAEVLRAQASLLGADSSGDRARPAIECALRVLARVGGADACRDGGLDFLRSGNGIGARLSGRLAARPWDLSPIVRATLPRRTSRPIPARGSVAIPDLVALAPLAELAAHPALLAQELFILLRNSGCARALAIVHTRDGRSFDARAREGWTAAEAVAAARHAGAVTTIACGPAPEDRWRLLVRQGGDVRAAAGLQALRAEVARLVALEALRRAQRERRFPWPPELAPPGDAGIFVSTAMLQLVGTARRVARSTLPILITGESGTGKEVLARLIHRQSERALRDFVPYNCSGAPRGMIDSQLFGHRRGAFTGAHENAPGLVRSADGGTLLRDEVSELDPHAQPKLLRLLENNEVQPLGAARPETVDVRVIVATNADLPALVREGRFREDLFFRLNGVHLPIPPLRERRDDIPALAHYFLRRHGAEHGRPHLRLAAGTLECLLRYAWPGNVRQLSNEIRRVAALADDGTPIAPEHLSTELRQAAAAADAAPEADGSAHRITVDPRQTIEAATATVERALIHRALEASDGRVGAAARLLGLSRKGLFLKRRRLGIDSASAGRAAP